MRPQAYDETIIEMTLKGSRRGHGLRHCRALIFGVVFEVVAAHIVLTRPKRVHYLQQVQTHEYVGKAKMFMPMRNILHLGLSCWWNSHSGPSAPPCPFMVRYLAPPMSGKRLI